MRYVLSCYCLKMFTELALNGYIIGWEEGVDASDQQDFMFRIGDSYKPLLATSAELTKWVDGHSMRQTLRLLNLQVFFQPSCVFTSKSQIDMSLFKHINQNYSQLPHVSRHSSSKMSQKIGSPKLSTTQTRFDFLLVFSRAAAQKKQQQLASQLRTCPSLFCFSDFARLQVASVHLASFGLDHTCHMAAQDVELPVVAPSVDRSLVHHQDQEPRNQDLEDLEEHQEHLCRKVAPKNFRENTVKAGWWLNQPIPKIWVKMGSSSPNRDEHKKIFETTT